MRCKGFNRHSWKNEVCKRCGKKRNPAMLKFGHKSKS